MTFSEYFSCWSFFYLLGFTPDECRDICASRAQKENRKREERRGQ